MHNTFFLLDSQSQTPQPPLETVVTPAVVQPQISPAAVEKMQAKTMGQLSLEALTAASTAVAQPHISAVQSFMIRAKMVIAFTLTITFITVAAVLWLLHDNDIYLVGADGSEVLPYKEAAPYLVGGIIFSSVALLVGKWAVQSGLLLPARLLILATNLYFGYFFGLPAFKVLYTGLTYYRIVHGYANDVILKTQQYTVKARTTIDEAQAGVKEMIEARCKNLSLEQAEYLLTKKAEAAKIWVDHSASHCNKFVDEQLALATTIKKVVPTLPEPVVVQRTLWEATWSVLNTSYNWVHANPGIILGVFVTAAGVVFYAWVNAENHDILAKQAGAAKDVAHQQLQQNASRENHVDAVSTKTEEILLAVRQLQPQVAAARILGTQTASNLATLTGDLKAGGMLPYLGFLQAQARQTSLLAELTAQNVLLKASLRDVARMAAEHSAWIQACSDAGTLIRFGPPTRPR